MLNLKGNLGLEIEQGMPSSKKKIPPTQSPFDKKDQDSMDMEIL
jgi:hypothetical protein